MSSNRCLSNAVQSLIRDLLVDFRIANPTFFGIAYVVLFHMSIPVGAVIFGSVLRGQTSVANVRGILKAIRKSVNKELTLLDKIGSAPMR